MCIKEIMHILLSMDTQGGVLWINDRSSIDLIQLLIWLIWLLILVWFITLYVIFCI